MRCKKQFKLLSSSRISPKFHTGSLSTPVILLSCHTNFWWYGSNNPFLSESIYSMVTYFSLWGWQVFGYLVENFCRLGVPHARPYGGIISRRSTTSVHNRLFISQSDIYGWTAKFSLQSHLFCSMTFDWAENLCGWHFVSGHWAYLPLKHNFAALSKLVFALAVKNKA